MPGNIEMRILNIIENTTASVEPDKILNIIASIESDIQTRCGPVEKLHTRSALETFSGSLAKFAEQTIRMRIIPIIQNHLISNGYAQPAMPIGTKNMAKGETLNLTGD